MDKAKTLEVLRGMKFMQRKEETKRRELFEVDQQKQLEKRLRAAAGAMDGDPTVPLSHAQPAGKVSGFATIVYDNSFPRESYNLARRSFFRKSSPPPSASVAATAEDAMGGSDLRAKRERDAENCGVGDQREEEEEEDASSDGCDDAGDDPTAVGGGSTRRFCVRVNAPVLPKGLARQVANEREQKRRRQEEREEE
ncbi:hypothetical protein DQ04_01681070 [Trypanosoma grayi]|uniref:hypothetical protein n=1 Tax=Trypanosoma grayi TaxID=71804 RepID=UPI0004F4698D|nr:hypothetical protein DQ04_01681070 [Trypanosoma grayi]KEG12477.1 hypothetical protein DQ04_01681070 [Trypanosoma grayi]